MNGFWRYEFGFTVTNCTAANYPTSIKIGFSIILQDKGCSYQSDPKQLGYSTCTSCSTSSLAVQFDFSSTSNPIQLTSYNKYPLNIGNCKYSSFWQNINLSICGSYHYVILDWDNQTFSVYVDGEYVCGLSSTQMSQIFIISSYPLFSTATKLSVKMWWKSYVK